MNNATEGGKQLALLWLLLGSALVIGAVWPTFNPAPGTIALAQGVGTASPANTPAGLTLSLISLTCTGQTLQVSFGVNVSANPQVTDYGSVSYMFNGESRRANFSGRSGNTTFYVDTITVQAPGSGMAVTISNGTVTLVTSGGSVTLQQSNPGTFNMTCASAEATTGTATLTGTATTTTSPTNTTTTIPATNTSTATASPTHTTTTVPATNTSTATPTQTTTAVSVTNTTTSTPTNTTTPVVATHTATATASPTITTTVTVTNTATATPTATASTTAVPIELTVSDIVCTGQNVQVIFQVTHLPPASDITNYGVVDYTLNGLNRTANMTGRTDDTATFVDSFTLAAPIASGTAEIPGGSLTLATTSGPITLNLSNPGTLSVVCTPVTAAPSPTATGTAAPTFVIATPTGTPTSTATSTRTPPSSVGGAATPGPSLPTSGGSHPDDILSLILLFGLMMMGGGALALVSSRQKGKA